MLLYDCTNPYNIRIEDTRFKVGKHFPNPHNRENTRICAIYPLKENLQETAHKQSQNFITPIPFMKVQILTM
jgi:hypothetical protein